VGAAASLVGIVTIGGSLISLGIPTGLQRFLGMMTKQREELLDYFSTAFIFSTIASLGFAITMLFVYRFRIAMVSFDLLTIVLLFLLILSGMGTYSAMFNSLFTSLLRIEYWAVTLVSSATVRIVVGLIMVNQGIGLPGILSGYLVASITVQILGLLFTRKLLRGFSMKFNAQKLLSTLRAASVSWIPDTVSIAAQWLGVLGLYALVGGLESGRFFMAFAIANVLLAIPVSFLNILLPVLSGMTDGRKTAVSRSIRLVYAATTPITYVAIAYADVVMGYIGSQYVGATPSLIILSLGALLMPITQGFTNLVYAYGRYGFVLALGLGANLARIFLYVPLGLIMGDTGVSLSYTLGFLPALVVVFYLSRRIKYSVGWRPILAAILLPAPLLGVPLLFPWQIGGLIIMVGCLLIYARVGVVDRQDVSEIARALLSEDIRRKIAPIAKPIISVLYGPKSNRNHSTTA
jgi:O-antigen/teichoic acid export membrane protein